ncbi:MULTISPECIES: TetR/AcrR family transcriptional regulator [unclassified Mesorhizobium]|uniref:TetR/AcrR family transcriptional regulator n=1 Tax=unclassified Mesorhizobium TaxID=325217 RepID=UPI0011286D06|nr:MULTISPECIES: TetR/AcrR family transcriptional regulator [unclassified Mesorhizobium]MBZ9742666.1 TetR/AcrR family transcriptional regulator [Mesorhizobium sp. CO1-1-4]MBZ9801225.1 TetR/AcrR family transcriptional regulator [Mesorhizobium sp. ES1-6]MBZ9992754.1 TetR/AcrR family transcriptional regulator [Mesorhizobium sp. BH1-1-4]TPL85088.1 TetR/AcrR family transcriptional regulator [Mesorhizobium sp. B2-3-12]
MKADSAPAKGKRPSKPAAPAKAARQTLSREAWIAAARKVLEKHGIGEVKIDRLAKQFKVTRGSFYFHFTSLADLRDGLLQEWRDINCQPFWAMREMHDVDGLQFFTDIVHVWVDEAPFSPLLDLAVRDWSRTSKKLAREVKDIDDLRVELLMRSFRAMGYPPDESLVRARITYFHQIGQYALSFKEDPAVRRSYQPLFGEVLLGPLVQERGSAPRPSEIKGGR